MVRKGGASFFFLVGPGKVALLSLNFINEDAPARTGTGIFLPFFSFSEKGAGGKKESVCEAFGVDTVFLPSTK